MDILPSIVRRGNHFIKLPGEYWNGKSVGWVLIDGPWFDYLTKLGGEYHRVRLFQARDWLECAVYADSPPIIMLPREEMEWEQIRWHPGTCIHPSQLSDSWLIFRWREALSHRKKEGWRLYPDGILPAYLNRIELIEDAWQSEQMYRMGY